jgi:hypothetical protein
VSSARLMRGAGGVWRAERNGLLRSWPSGRRKERKIRIRTHNPSVKYRVLYFLSYRGVALRYIFFGSSTGLCNTVLQLAARLLQVGLMDYAGLLCSACLVMRRVQGNRVRADVLPLHVLPPASRAQCK